MKVLKNHIAQIVFSILMAIAGVAFSVLPYYALADIIMKMIGGERVFANYQNDLLFILAGFLLNIIFHEISTITSHNLAFRIIEKA